MVYKFHSIPIGLVGYDAVLQSKILNLPFCTISLLFCFGLVIKIKNIRILI